ncbi:MAG: hypothetical protein A2Y14_04710 [Verrucomicrobia bacterium GWF2_51_19]|nr:MAG: hypothetical protein A2Y14_04710 [Verrucomicrobia bacterium GWF2_51_19]HCJ12292.1 cysteine desulfurase CsdA [Opitutae bacterium]
MRDDFPIFKNNPRLVYLDSAATIQRPQAVIDCISDFYERFNANVHRGIYDLSEHATQLYEGARKRIAAYIGAESVIFTRNTTESINLVAHLFEEQLGAQDEILLTEMEHHSNIVPWYLLAKKTGAVLQVVNIDDNGDLDLDDFAKKLTPRTKIFCVTHISNVLGTVNPLKELIEKAHRNGTLVCVDGAQSLAHEKVDVRELDCDYFASSAHKAYGPTGIGILYAKKELLKNARPYQGGGSMIHRVSFEKISFAEPPMRYEAGTPNISGAIGMGAAIDYIQKIGLTTLLQHDKTLLAYAQKRFKEIPAIAIIGNPKKRSGILSFRLGKLHPHDVATALNTETIAIRAGNHCAQPLMKRLNEPGTTRISFGIYNTFDDIDRLVAALEKTLKILS